VDFGRLSDPPGYWLPLTVELQFDPSISAAELSYLDACRQNRSLKIGEPLKHALQRQIGRAFEHVRLAPANVPVDGAVETSLGIAELTRFIPRQASRTYSVTLTLGGTASYTSARGEALFTKSLKTEVRRDVYSEERNCEIGGMDKLVEKATHNLAVGFAEALGTSIKIQEAAQARSVHR
jgi:hypothetical protein